MTLLGQPKINSTSTQKITPADNNQNGRVPLRAHTQIISIPERSNSTISTSSLQNTFDTKKAKESYERITKQLEVRLCLNFTKIKKNKSLLCVEIKSRSRSTTCERSKS